MTDVIGYDPVLCNLGVADHGPNVDPIIIDPSGDSPTDDDEDIDYSVYFMEVYERQQKLRAADPSMWVRHMWKGATEFQIIPMQARGTTILALAYEEGVMLAIDHSFASTLFVEKVIDLNSHVLAVYYQETADCESFLRGLQSQFHQHELETGRRITVEEASSWVADNMRSCQQCDKDLAPEEILIVGWSEESAEPRMFRVNSVGERFRRLVYTHGSGDQYCCYPLDSSYQDIVSYDGAVEYVRDKIVKLARRVSLDIKHGKPGESGGFISGYHVGAHGTKVVFHNEDVGEPTRQELEQFFDSVAH